MACDPAAHTKIGTKKPQWSRLQGISQYRVWMINVPVHSVHHQQENSERVPCLAVGPGHGRFPFRSCSLEMTLEMIPHLWAHQCRSRSSRRIRILLRSWRRVDCWPIIWNGITRATPVVVLLGVRGFLGFGGQICGGGVQIDGWVQYAELEGGLHRFHGAWTLQRCWYAARPTCHVPVV